MRIERQGRDGYTMWLSARETLLWAARPWNRWPCSALVGRRVRVEADDTGLIGVAVRGRATDVPAEELKAIVADHMPLDLRHLWPFPTTTTKENL